MHPAQELWEAKYERWLHGVPEVGGSGLINCACHPVFDCDCLHPHNSDYCELLVAVVGFNVAMFGVENPAEEEE